MNITNNRNNPPRSGVVEQSANSQPLEANESLASSPQSQLFKCSAQDRVFYYSPLATKIGQYLSVKEALSFFSVSRIKRPTREAYFIHKLVGDFKLCIPEIQAYLQEAAPFIDLNAPTGAIRPLEELYKSYSLSLSKLQKLALKKLDGLLRPLHFRHIGSSDRVFSSENTVADFCYLVKSHFKLYEMDLNQLVIQVTSLTRQIPPYLDGLIARGFPPEAVLAAHELPFMLRQSLGCLLMNTPQSLANNELAALRLFSCGLNFITTLAQHGTTILRLIYTLNLGLQDELALAALRKLSLAFNDGVSIKHVFAVEYLVNHLIFSPATALNELTDLNSQQAEALYTLELSFGDIQLLRQFRLANNDWYNNTHTEIFEYLILRDHLSFSLAFNVLLPLSEPQRVAIVTFGLSATQVPQLLEIGGTDLSYADIRNAKFSALKHKIDPLQALAIEKSCAGKLLITTKNQL